MVIRLLLGVKFFGNGATVPVKFILNFVLVGCCLVVMGRFYLYGKRGAVGGIELRWFCEDFCHAIIQKKNQDFFNDWNHCYPK